MLKTQNYSLKSETTTKTKKKKYFTMLKTHYYSYKTETKKKTKNNI